MKRRETKEASITTDLILKYAPHRFGLIQWRKFDFTTLDLLRITYESSGHHVKMCERYYATEVFTNHGNKVQ